MQTTAIPYRQSCIYPALFEKQHAKRIADGAAHIWRPNQYFWTSGEHESEFVKPSSLRGSNNIHTRMQSGTKTQSEKLHPTAPHFFIAFWLELQMQTRLSTTDYFIVYNPEYDTARQRKCRSREFRSEAAPDLFRYAARFCILKGA